jgi:hypothetical protein
MRGLAMHDVKPIPAFCAIPARAGRPSIPEVGGFHTRGEQ